MLVLGTAITGNCTPSDALLTFTNKSSGAQFATLANGSLAYATTLPPGTYAVGVNGIASCTQLPEGVVLVVCTLVIP